MTEQDLMKCPQCKKVGYQLVVRARDAAAGVLADLSSGLELADITKALGRSGWRHLHDHAGLVKPCAEHQDPVAT